ncbi:MAG: hypothetical protein JWP02_620 [Acidimicrobiales bacterium]|nr:hypothetical protein [Acidimicrobiales bacterium]
MGAAARVNRVTVSPEQFALVLFDAAEIASIVSGLADRLDLGDRPIEIEVDERTPLGSSAVTSLDPITITAESGAFEDAKRLRHLSPTSVKAVVGRHLLRARDRLDPSFGDPPPDGEIPIGHYTAWDVYAVARLHRLGYPDQRPRRQYHFRIRHGFTDASDRVFNRLWSAEGLRWSDLVAASEEAAASRPTAPGKAKGRSKAAQGRT